MKSKLIRIVIAGAAALIGLVLAIVLSKPPHQVTVAVVKTPIAAGTPLTSANLTHESVAATWAQAAGLLTPQQAVGFRSAVALPVGVPIPVADRWSEHIGGANVALPLTISEGAAEGVQTGSFVAVYKTTSGGGAGSLMGTGVPVLAIYTPSGAPNPQTQEVVVLDVPAHVAASLVGTTIALGVMAGHPATQWNMGGTGTISSTSSVSPSGSSSLPSSASKSGTAKTKKP